VRYIFIWLGFGFGMLQERDGLVGGYKRYKDLFMMMKVLEANKPQNPFETAPRPDMDLRMSYNDDSRNYEQQRKKLESQLDQARLSFRQGLDLSAGEAAAMEATWKYEFAVGRYNKEIVRLTKDLEIEQERLGISDEEAGEIRKCGVEFKYRKS
jgi:hypothetical protein